MSVKQRTATEERDLVLDYLIERVEDLESKFEDERKWWHDRLEWYIDWFNGRIVEVQESLAADRSQENLVKAIEL